MTATEGRRPGRAGSRSEQLASDLLESIREGVVRPGAKLPTESELSAMHGVSRTVVREAIAQLRAAGIVRSSQGRGTFVLAVPTSHPLTIDAVDPGDLASMLALLELRVGVEVEAAQLASLRSTPRQRAVLHERLAAFSAARDDPAAALDADFGFHLAVARASGNPHFARLLESLGVEMMAVPRARLSRDDARFERVVDEHTSIEAAIADGDPSAAAAAMRTHLLNSARRLRGE